MQKIALVLLTSLALLGSSGCSFKKNGQGPSIVAKKDKELKAQSIGEMTNLSDEESLETLKSMSKEQLEKSGALDWSIVNNRKYIVSYLLSERELSPFDYNEKSVEILNRNPVTKAVVESYQQPAIVSLVNNLRKSADPLLWEQLLENTKIKAQNCPSIFIQVVDLYLYSPNRVKDKQYKRFSQENVIEFFNSLKGTHTCHDISNTISSDQLARWYVAELKIQSLQHFSSSDLILLFDSIKNTQDLALEYLTGDGLIKIDPILVMMASIGDYNVSNKRKWIDILKPHLSPSPLFYNLKYDSCEDLLSSNPEDLLCEGENAENISTVKSIIEKKSGYEAQQ